MKCAEAEDGQSTGDYALYGTGELFKEVGKLVDIKTDRKRLNCQNSVFLFVTMIVEAGALIHLKL